MSVRQQQKFVDYIVVGNHNFVAQLGKHPHSLAVSQGASCVERGPVIGDERFEEREGFCVLQRYIAAAYRNRSVKTPCQAAARSGSAGFQCQGSKSAIWRFG